MPDFIPIRVNDQDVQVPADADLSVVLEEVGLRMDAKGIALALDGLVIPRARWASTRPSPHSVIEIVTAAQGG